MTTTTGYVEANTEAEINANITSFTYGTYSYGASPYGNLHVKTFLNSDGTTPCSIDSITACDSGHSNKYHPSRP